MAASLYGRAVEECLPTQRSCHQWPGCSLSSRPGGVESASESGRREPSRSSIASTSRSGSRRSGSSPADGEQLGIISDGRGAESCAREAGLDLVEVAPNEKPPVCRIMDFGKFKYQQKEETSHRTHVHHDEDQGNSPAAQDRRARHRFQGESGKRFSATTRTRSSCRSCSEVVSWRTLTKDSG